MSALASYGRILLASLCCCAALVAGCGGAATREARHLAKGHAFFADGSFEKARVEYRNALQIAPNDSEARFENGVVDEKLGNPREAAQFYQGAIDANSDNIQARVNLGKIFVLGAAPDRALDTVQPSLGRHPDDAGLLTVRAAARQQLKDGDAALADARRAVQVAPDNEDAIAVLAGIYTSRNESGQARALLESAVKNIPGTVDLRLALAQLYSNEGLNLEVEAVLLEVIRLKPDEKTNRLRLAQFYAHADRIDQAEHVLRDAVEKFPNDDTLKSDLVQFLASRRGAEVAQAELATMVSANPKDYDIRFIQALFFVQGKQPAKAEAVYHDVIAAAGTDAAGLTARDRLASLRLQSGDSVAADRLLAEVLAKSPRDNDALILRGNLSLERKDPKSAIADLRSVLRDQPNSILVMRTLARAHMENGEPALAEEILRRAVEANPKDSVVRVDLARLLMNLGRPEQAKPLVDELVKQEPGNMQFLDEQFHVDVAMSDGIGAKAAADAMVAAQPTSPAGYFYQGGIAEAAKRPQDALHLYEQALMLQPDLSDALSAESRVLVELHRTPEALKRLDQACDRFPKLPFAPNLKGELLLVLQRPADAEIAFKTAIEREPTWWNPYRNLSLAQRAQNDMTGAVASLRDGIAKVPHPEALQVALADAYERTSKPDDAIQVYDAALRKDPQSEPMANNLAMLLVTYKKDPASLDRAKQLAVRFSGSANSAYLDTYGWVLYKHGEPEAAVAALETVVSRTSGLSVPLYHLGMAQASAGQAEAARDSLRRSLQSGKNFSGMEEAKATLDKLAKLNSPASPRS